jgi:hypothetical protein
MTASVSDSNSDNFLVSGRHFALSTAGVEMILAQMAATNARRHPSRRAGAPQDYGALLRLRR